MKIENIHLAFSEEDKKKIHSQNWLDLDDAAWILGILTGDIIIEKAGVFKTTRTPWKRIDAAIKTNLPTKNTDPNFTNLTNGERKHISKKDFIRWLKAEKVEIDDDGRAMLAELGIMKPASGEKENKGGKPSECFTKAVEHLYLELLKSGNTEIIKPRKVREFAARLKEAITEGNRNFSDDIAGWIKDVKGVGGNLKITTQDRPIKEGTIEKGRPYKLNDLSKRLTDLREKYPLH